MEKQTLNGRNKFVNAMNQHSARKRPNFTTNYS